MNKRIRIISAKPYNWYHVGEEYIVLSTRNYENIGVQVVRENNFHEPDVVTYGDFEYIKD